MISELSASNQHTLSERCNQRSLALNDPEHLYEPSGFQTLNTGDTALWMAGLMYAYTDQREDHTDYLLQCSVQITELDRKLARAYSVYEIGGDNNTPMNRCRPLYQTSMTDCDKTNELWLQMNDDEGKFLRDWEREKEETYYKENKDLVD